LTKTGGGNLILSGNSSYSGNTTIYNGTLAPSGTNVSSVTIKSGAVLELQLTSTSNASAILSGALVLESGSKIRIVGTPTANSTNTLVSASSVSHLTALEAPISGFEIAACGNSLVLRPSTPTPIPATIEFGNLTQPFDGASKSVTVTTSPSSLSSTITYNGLTTPPITVGSDYYAVGLSRQRHRRADHFGFLGCLEKTPLRNHI
jgi:autotransporter-associated beta strand protein